MRSRTNNAEKPNSDVLKRPQSVPLLKRRNAVKSQKGKL